MTCQCGLKQRLRPIASRSWWDNRRFIASVRGVLFYGMIVAMLMGVVFCVAAIAATAWFAIIDYTLKAGH